MSKSKPLNEGYQPKNEKFGYQPSNSTVKKGYQPQAVQQTPNNPPSGGSNVKPPQGSGKK